ncbi:hypothetical protein [Streptomyces sp. NPDC126514]|uniref:hypothetical protein n=1 Tax=Streptomyces sp. NPDC126514 TaxID=3155210 RepID=UPI00332EB445
MRHQLDQERLRGLESLRVVEPHPELQLVPAPFHRVGAAHPQPLRAKAGDVGDATQAVLVSAAALSCSKCAGRCCMEGWWTWVGLFPVQEKWIMTYEETRPAAPAITAVLPRLLPGLMAQDVMPWELRLGDVVPFDDGVGRPVLDIRAVGAGQRGRCLFFSGVPPLLASGRLTVYRSCSSLPTQSVSARRAAII